MYQTKLKTNIKTLDCYTVIREYFNGIYTKLWRIGIGKKRAGKWHSFKYNHSLASSNMYILIQVHNTSRAEIIGLAGLTLGFKTNSSPPEINKYEFSCLQTFNIMNGVPYI